jgi:superfamily II DNA/RNA helicase
LQIKNKSFLRFKMNNNRTSSTWTVVRSGVKKFGNKRSGGFGGRKSFGTKTRSENSESFQRSETRTEGRNERSQAFGERNQGGQSYSSGFRGQGQRSGGRSFGGGFRKSGGGGFGGRRFGGGGRGFRKSPGTSHDKYIQKAVITEEEVFVPTHTFLDFKADERLLKNLETLKILTPTPIQDKSIPVGLEGRDVLGIANTGTGKTLAFLLPIVTKILQENKKAIVLAPTRELAAQIEKDFRNLTLNMRLWTHLVIGGANMWRQIRQAKMRNDIVIGTPGRLVDLMKRKVLNLSDISLVVLDEADRMLDMGFREDIEKILENCQTEGRQTFCFSATMPKELERIAEKFMKEPVKISVKMQETSKNVDQDIIKFTDSHDKIEKLHDLLNKPEFTKSIIFCRTKSGTEKLEGELFKRGFKAKYIHGDLRQGQRNRAISDFKDGFVKILIATDVASRGLDIKDVTHVINYDEPENYEDYTHRIGRTGRAGKKGFAYTFVQSRDY